MKLIVFGGTGQTGLAVLRLSAQDKGLQVTAFVRTPTKVPEEIRKKLHIVQGDVLNEENVANAIEGHDAVISCLGTGYYIGPTTLVQNGIINIVNGMREHGVKKLAWVSTSFLFPGSWTPFPLKAPTVDHRRALEFLKKSKDISWIAMMPPQIVNLSTGRSYTTAINKVPGSQVATTTDIADWMIHTLRHDEETAEYAHQLVGISSRITWTQWITRSVPGQILLVTLILALLTWYYYITSK